MIVRRDDNSLVDVEFVLALSSSLTPAYVCTPSEVDCSFFIAMVDLWSADARQETNLVVHPSSTDRSAPSHSSKLRRRGGSVSVAQSRSGNQSPIKSQSTPNLSHYRTPGADA